MRFFIVMCLIAVAQADKLGYNYSPVEHSDAGLSFVPGSSSINAVPSYSDSSYNAPANGYVSPASASAPVLSDPAGFNKEFYSFAANDEDFAQSANAEQFSNLFDKNLRVIFIKGPEHSGLEDAAAALAKQASEQKTAIYVLNKQADLSELANKLKNLGSNANNKPDVHFVKYRTPEDAANAQNAIQSQYNSLGGNSKSYNGGVAPALNFASQAAVKHNEAVVTPQGSYLPASVLYRLRV